MYDYANGDFSESTGHATQMLWKSSTALGCGYAEGCKLLVCRYSPPGARGAAEGRGRAGLWAAGRVSLHLPLILPLSAPPRVRSQVTMPSGLSCLRANPRRQCHRPLPGECVPANRRQVERNRAAHSGGGASNRTGRPPGAPMKALLGAKPPVAALPCPALP